MKSTITWHKCEYGVPKDNNLYICMLEEPFHDSSYFCMLLKHVGNGVWADEHNCEQTYHRVVAWADPYTDVDISDDDIDWIEGE